MKKNSKERLFEVMQKVNSDFKVRLNEEAIPENPDFRLQTYGDLQKLINVIQLKQRGKKLAGIGFDAILGAIPGLGTAKTAFDVVRAAFGRPDDRKTNTWLDKLDIDDETSAIVDDTVENGFLQMMSNKINRENPEKQLEPDFDMNKELVNYLSQKYDRRTITGIPPKN